MNAVKVYRLGDINKAQRRIFKTYNAMKSPMVSNNLALHFTDKAFDT